MPAGAYGRAMRAMQWSKRDIANMVECTQVRYGDGCGDREQQKREAGKETTAIGYPHLRTVSSG